jgi:MFS family permease
LFRRSSAEGYSIVKSFTYSVVIYAAVIPAYVFGGQVVEWIDRKYSILLAFAATALSGTLFGLSTRPSGILIFGGLTAFFLALGSASIYTYTPELYPTEVRATGMGIASAWGRVGAIAVLLSFGFFFAIRQIAAVCYQRFDIALGRGRSCVLRSPYARAARKKRHEASGGGSSATNELPRCATLSQRRWLD